MRLLRAGSQSANTLVVFKPPIDHNQGDGSQNLSEKSLEATFLRLLQPAPHH